MFKTSVITVITFLFPPLSHVAVCLALMHHIPMLLCVLMFIMGLYRTSFFKKFEASTEVIFYHVIILKRKFNMLEQNP